MNANQLRQRARHLRELANAIEALAVMSLEGHADDDTWRGPRPMLCRSTLGTNQQQLHAAADDLRSHAHLFERRAAQLDAIAASRVGVAG
ncbi:MAG TPA: hypothetical protein VES40_04160 [Ilumatobacteraceae bacterium]|nr:hypothetical protein [Ilumatobacteraceae bacterium]